MLQTSCTMHYWICRDQQPFNVMPQMMVALVKQAFAGNFSQIASLKPAAKPLSIQLRPAELRHPGTAVLPYHHNPHQKMDLIFGCSEPMLYGPQSCWQASTKPRPEIATYDNSACVDQGLLHHVSCMVPCATVVVAHAPGHLCPGCREIHFRTLTTEQNFWMCST